MPLLVGMVEGVAVALLPDLWCVLYVEFGWGVSLFYLHGKAEGCTALSPLLEAVLFQLYSGKHPKVKGDDTCIAPLLEPSPTQRHLATWPTYHVCNGISQSYLPPTCMICTRHLQFVFYQKCIWVLLSKCRCLSVLYFRNRFVRSVIIKFCK
jgi:hypothetical protein